jgi:hypothetical protein
MTRFARFLLLFLLFDALVIGGYLLLKGKGGGGADAYQWTTIDEAYAPKNAVEEFIKMDAANRAALPAFIKNYGKDARMLKRFKGRQFAAPTENVLSMFFKGLDDWMLVDIKIKGENEREAVRTVLYIYANTQWKVGDSGTLLK